MSEEDSKRLEELGYAGALTPTSADDSTQTEGNASTALKGDPPLVDRSLLIRGDAHLWAFKRAMEAKGKNIHHEKLAAGLEEARTCYRNFARLYPDKNLWIEWRLKYLDIALLFMNATKVKKNK